MAWGAGCIAGLVVLLALACAAPAPAAAAGCRGQEAVVRGKLVCLKAKARCRPAQKADLKRAGWTCTRKRRLKRGSLRLRRRGGPIAVEPSGHVGLQAALQAFDQVVAPLPGVKRIRGAVGRVDSATDPRLWIARHRSRLTKAQRRVVDRERRPRRGRTRRLSHDAASDLAKAQQVLDETLPRVQARLGVVLDVPIKLGVAEKHPTVKGALAGARASFKGSSAPCEIDVYASWLASGPDTQRPAMAHEIGHCLQGRRGTEAELSGQPWIREGGITWLASSIAAQWMGAAYSSDHYANYIASIGTPLTDLSYDALGVWQELDEAGADAEELIFSLLTKEEPYVGLVAAGGEPFATDWAPGYFRAPGIGPAWDIKGPGLKSKASAPSDEVDVALGDELTLPVAFRTNALYGVELTAPVLAISGDAPGRMRGATGLDGPLRPGLYCAAASPTCRCPVLGSRVLVALSGVRSSTALKLSGRTEDACATEPPPNATPTPTPAPPTPPAAGDTVVTISGADNRTITVNPSCTRRPPGPSAGVPGYDGSYSVVFPYSAPPEVGPLSLELDGRTFDPKGGTYEVRGHGKDEPVQVHHGAFYDTKVNGKGPFSTEWAQAGAATGTITVDPVLGVGELDVRMYNTYASGTGPGAVQVRARGRWTCRS